MPNIIKNIESMEKQLIDLRQLIMEITPSVSLDMGITLKTISAKTLAKTLEDLCNKSWLDLECGENCEEDREKLLDRLDVINNEIKRLNAQIAPTPRASTCTTATEDRTIVPPLVAGPARRYSCFSQNSSVFRSSEDRDSYYEPSAPCSGIVSPL